MTLTAELVRELLDYDPETGVFLHRTKRRGSKQGSVVGTKTANGYRSVAIHKKQYLAHRVAWLYVHGEWPTGQIDHINGIRDDNRLCNLRDVPQNINMQNQRVAHKCKTSTRLLGVYYEKKSGRWYSQIRIDGKSRHLGTFATDIEAHEAYLQAKRKLHSGSVL